MRTVVLPLEISGYEELPMEILNQILPTLLACNPKKDVLKVVIAEDNSFQVYINGVRRRHLEHNPAIRHKILA